MRPVQGHERRECPKEFQDRLTRTFGKNQFGEPLFRIVWGQSEFIRMGDIWRDRFGNERRGYRDTYQCHGTPCWNIMRWKQPAQYGSPEVFYQNTWDEHSKLHFLGEYPWRGRYEIVQPLMRTEMTEGKLVTVWIRSLNPHTMKFEDVPVRKRVDQRLIVHHLPLTHILIDKIIPLIIKVQSLSAEERKAAQEDAKRRQHKQEVEMVADALAENMPSYLGPVSYSRQGIRTSLLDRKMEQIERVWKRELRGGKRFVKGFQTGDRPLTVTR